MVEANSVGGGNKITLDDLVKALDRRDLARGSVPKVKTFLFKGERVSDWLELVEQAMVGVADVVKFQRILVYHGLHEEVKKVIAASNDGWSRFKDGMQRKYQLGDGLLTAAELEALNRNDYTTVGALAEDFKKKARKVPGISKEEQCAIFLGLFKSMEAQELTSKGGGGEKLTWATIDKGVQEGDLNEVHQFQMRQHRKKRKERDAGTTRAPDMKNVVSDVLSELGISKDQIEQRKVVTIVQGWGKEGVGEEVGQENYGKEETGSQTLTKAQCQQRNLLLGGQGSGKAQIPQAIPMCNPYNSWGGGQVSSGQMVPYSGSPASAGPPSFPAAQGQFAAQPPPTQQASQASMVGRGNQGQGGQGNGDRGQGGRGGEERGQGRNGGGRGGGWNGQGGQGQGNQGGQEGGQGYGRPRFDWRNAICRHCGIIGHTIRFCQQRRDDELSGPSSTNMDGDIYDNFGKYIEPRTPGGVRQEALRRAAVRPAPPTMFKLWQERQDSAVRVEEIVEESEEVTQRLKAGTIKEEPIVVESNDEKLGEMRESAITILGRMEDLLEKVSRYQQKLKDLCDETQEWKANLPGLFLYESGPGPTSGQQGYPGFATVGSGPRSGMAYRPPTSHGRVPQAARTRGLSKAGTSQVHSQAPSQALPRREPEPERRKEVVEVPEEEDEDDDEEDERLRQEEDRRAELRARKRGAQEEAEPSQCDSVPKRKKYAVRLEEGFDVERMVDRLLEGHDDLMNLKDILTSAPRLRDSLRGRISRRSDFSKTVMQRGGRDARPRQRPLGASGGDDQHRPFRRESTPVFDDDNIELFLDAYQGHATRRGWTTLEMIRNLRGAGRFEEPIAHIQSGEVPAPPQEVITSPKQVETMKRLEEGGRDETCATIDSRLAAHASEHPDIKVPAPSEPSLGSPHAERGKGTKTLARGTQGAQAGRPQRETAEEKSARVQARLAEIYEKKVEMEAAGVESASPVDPRTSEQKIDEMWFKYESRRDAARQRSKGTGQADEKANEGRETRDLGLSAARMAIERVDRRIRQAATTSFHRYSLLSDELAIRKMEVEQLTTHLAEEKAENLAWRAHMEAKEVEWEKKLQDIAVAVERLSATKVVDWTEQSRYGIRGEGMQGLFGQRGAAEPSQQERLKKVFLEPTEAEMKRKAEEGSFSFRTPTELASQQATPISFEVLAERPTQGPQPPPAEEGSAEESLAILLEVQGGILTGAVVPTQPEAEKREGSRLDELVAAMEVDMPLERPQRLDTPERVPEMGELRAQLGSWATGTYSRGHVSGQQQQEATSHPAMTVASQSSDPHGKKKKKFQRKSKNICFYFQDGMHRALECPKFLEDKAAGRVTERDGRMYDRQGRIVERTADGGRAQLYRQNQEEMSE
ncbi:hypothetical protein CBR_g40619 [Chara braunii]|uniref:Uncharacterized protein n=1 Tax=Chara braunii TaxID=69332 RepID=A0A388LU75_CHABU|nr:hypothetical protein CBR_g40619 [Chara braunii]|eukprot:GBG85809.1 hypothetical protein CBR_g40619 [Chara braunii]